MPETFASTAIRIAAAALIASCASAVGPGDDPNAAEVTAFVGARIFDGTGGPLIDNGVLTVRQGRVAAVGIASEVEIPAGAQRIEAAGRTIIPGLINTHGHVGDTLGLEGGHYDADNILRHLRLYGRYGITTVNSLGGDGKEAGAVRRQQDTPELDRARLLFAGSVITADAEDSARQAVDANVELEPDFIKIRVDDNLGTSSKMRPEVYAAVIDQAHRNQLRVATHIFYLDDAKGVLRSGADFIVHSVRDREVDDELVTLLQERQVCYSPTLVREVSTFVYEQVPEFFQDPFFVEEADAAVLARLRDPESQRRFRDSPSAQRYKQALKIASRNLEQLATAGVTIAFGTDSGPPARFQGYFEHMELELMADAGLSPRQILLSATRDAAACLGLDDLGTLEVGKWADFVVLDADPLADITNSRSIRSVWIAGNRVPGRDQVGDTR